MGRIMKTLAFVILVLCLVTTLVLATYAGGFNWAVFVSGLLISALVFGLLYSVGAALDLLVDIKDQLHVVTSRMPAASNAPASRLSGVAPIATIASANPTRQAVGQTVTTRTNNPILRPYSVSASRVKCQKCGKVQAADEPACIMCGCRFK